jgi:hypothetical protein
LLGEHGIQRDTPAGRQELKRCMERRHLKEANEEALEAFRQTWYVGASPRASHLAPLAGA